MPESGTFNKRGSIHQDRIFQVEHKGIEKIVTNERHGSPFQLFTLWLGANLTIADFALGFLPVHLGLSWSAILISLIIGNLLGALLLSLTTVMGPRFGLPQLIIGRLSFGKAGGYLPAFLNWIGTIGWFTVNNILGVFGLKIIIPNLSLLMGSILLIAIQGFLVIFGHNLIQAFERLMAIILGILFLIATFLISDLHSGQLFHYHGTTPHPIATSLIVLGAAFSYLVSWAPYASDYSRYLPEETSQTQMILWTFFGGFLSSTWLELLGAMVAIVAGQRGNNAIASFSYVMGNWGIPMVIAVVLGGIASNSINLYSNTLSAGALDLKMSRTSLTVIAMIIGLVFCLIGANGFESFYEDFLLLLGYWVTPWIAVILVDFFVFKRNSKGFLEESADRRIGKGIWAFILGIIIAIPFFSSTLYTGPIAKQLNGADLSFYVAFFVAGVIYITIGRSKKLTSP